jgi:hypothetical protein
VTEALLALGAVVGLSAALTTFVILTILARLRKLEARQEVSSTWQQAPIDDDEDD